MPVPEIESIKADTDAERLGHLIAEAFVDLPPSLWLCPDEVLRQAVFPGYFTGYVRDALENGLVLATSSLDAVALWFPRGPDPEPAPELDPEITVRVGRFADRFRRFDRLLHENHPRGKAHHHLAILAVHPDKQGRGLGSALLDFHHCYLDAVEEPSYLEAASERTRRLYLQHGYADCGDPIEIDAQARMYPMWREPASA